MCRQPADWIIGNWSTSQLVKWSIGRAVNKLIRELENWKISKKSQLFTDCHSPLNVHIITSYLIS
jgi:hypothetical protein